MNLTRRAASHHRTVLAYVSVLVSTVAAVEAESAPRRPSPTAQGCTLSGEELDKLRDKNPGAMNACGDLANKAAKDGRSFSFMCDAGGKVSCCDDRQCITVVAIKRSVLPRLGTNPPVLQRRGIEGETPATSEKEGK